MLSMNEGYKNVLKSDEQQYDVYIILADGTRVDADISGFRVIYNLGEKIIGNFASKKVEFNLFNTSLYNITNSEFEVFVGLQVNNELSYNSIGKYIANKPVLKDETLDECTISAQCYSLKFKVPYTNILTFPCTIKVALTAICEHLNVPYIENNFINGDYVLNKFYIEEEATFFDVIKILVEAGFANAYVTNTNSLIVKSPSAAPVYEFGLNELFELEKEDNKFGPVNSVVASRIVADDGSTTEDVYAINESSIIANGLYEYKIIQNEAIDYDRQTAVNNMLTGILNFNYIPATIETVYNPKLEIGDMLEVPDKKTNTSFLLFAKQISADLATGLMTIESTEETKTETDYKSATNKDKRKKTEAKVNKLEGKITLLSEQQEEQTEKVAKLELDVDSIKGEISTIADITMTAEGYGKLEFENVNESEPIAVRIHPTSKDITPLYPADDLYPSDDLYPHNRELYFVPENSENETIIYNIPKNLYYLNGAYDEFVLDYENQECYIIHRIGLNSSGEKYKLENTTTEYFDYPLIQLKDDNYTITLDVFNNAYIYTRLMSKNMYTSQFSTKVETNSKIEQKANEINESVSKTYSTKGELQTEKSERIQTANEINQTIEEETNGVKIVSKINQTASGTKINGNKIELSANDILNLLAGNTINLGSKSITIASENFNVDANGNMNCNNANMTNAKIKTSDTGMDNKDAGLLAESSNYSGEYYSNGINIYNKNTDNADFVNIKPGSIVSYNNSRYGFDFAVGSDGKITWLIKDSAGKLLQASGTQFNLWSPGQNTNLMLNNSSAYINGYQIQTATSDRRLKTNIQDSKENALDKIMQIQHRSFEWKENGKEQKNGYIAQELEKIDEEFVIKNEDRYSINLLNLLATTTKAVQELNLKIEESQQEILMLKGEK